jgi:calcium-translocating P-type ATPase
VGDQEASQTFCSPDAISAMARMRATRHVHCSGVLEGGEMILEADGTSGPCGLTEAEAASRLRRDGPNVLPAARPPPLWRLLTKQVTHFFAVMLWVAGALALIAGMPQLGVAIFAIIVVNGLFAFVQEHRAERSAERLRDLLPRRATVLRDGDTRDGDASELVVGDVILLAAGDRISADARVAEAYALAVDTSTLTGESNPVRVEAGGDLFAGTYVVEGEARAEVTSTGSRTRLGAIALLTRAGHRPQSQLAKELSRIVRTIAWISTGVGLVFFAIGAWIGLPPAAGFLLAIGVTVALVPEGLLPTVTLSLAIGARRMAARRALVRRLESVETLGSTTFICTDKTGTLTMNQMMVVEVWTPRGWAHVTGTGYEPLGEVRTDSATLADLRELALAAARCSTGHAVLEGARWVARGDPMEAALDVLARRVGLDPARDARARPALHRFPFDPRRRRMSIIVGDTLVVKGAPDTVLHRCHETAGAAEALHAMAERSLRVIAIASRRMGTGWQDGTEPPRHLVADLIETDLDLLGLVGLEDPPRQGAAETIKACRRAGIKVAMVTGDHPATASAIAREVGLLGDAGIVVQAGELPADDVALGILVDRDGIVISRVSSEDKLRIARALRQRGHVVAMTGDGVNDGPALHEADIGVAMGRGGTDVAREAADLILLDDDLATIVAAVEQGRATFSNVRRFLTYHLTDNVAELAPFAVWALTGGRIPLALKVLQILFLDLGTDQLPALGLGAEPPNARALERMPPVRHLLDRVVLQRAFLVLGPVEALMEMAAFVTVLLQSGWRPGNAFPSGETLLAASGAAFTAVVLGQAANAFACRSTTRGIASNWASNPLLLTGVGTELLLLGACLFIPPLAALLGQAPPPRAGWVVAALAAPAVLLADSLHKWMGRRRAGGARHLSRARREKQRRNTLGSRPDGLERWP